jgi:hypothetical protein
MTLPSISSLEREIVMSEGCDLPIQLFEIEVVEGGDLERKAGGMVATTRMARDPTAALQTTAVLRKTVLQVYEFGLELLQPAVDLVVESEY